MHKGRARINSDLPDTFIGRCGELTGMDGYTDAPHPATKERGERYLDAVGLSVAAWLVGAYRSMEEGERSPQAEL